MRRQSSPSILQRRRIFLGCEGESEQSYGKLIQEVSNSCQLAVYIDAEPIKPPSGDPLTIVTNAVAMITHKIALRGDYERRFLLLDSDTRGLAPEKDRQAETGARTAGLVLIWQDPCHEALLLRHLDACASLRPPTCREAVSELTKRWPDYRKGIPASRLAARIHHHAVLRAAGVEPGLKRFLEAVGLTGT